MTINVAITVCCGISARYRVPCSERLSNGFFSGHSSVITNLWSSSDDTPRTSCYTIHVCSIKFIFISQNLSLHWRVMFSYVLFPKHPVILQRATSIYRNTHHVTALVRMRIRPKRSLVSVHDFYLSKHSNKITKWKTNSSAKQINYTENNYPQNQNEKGQLIYDPQSETTIDSCLWLGTTLT